VAGIANTKDANGGVMSGECNICGNMGCVEANHSVMDMYGAVDKAQPTKDYVYRLKLKALFYEAMADLDFAKIHAAMLAVRWTWYGSGGVPSKGDLRDAVDRMARTVCSEISYEALVKGIGSQFTGGLFYIIRADEDGPYRVTIGHGFIGEAECLDDEQ
jgi:hypothetical protein